MNSTSLISLDEKLYDILVVKGPQTRNQLVKITKNKRSTIYDALVRLDLKGKVGKHSKKTSNRGRPKVFFNAVATDMKPQGI